MPLPSSRSRRRARGRARGVAAERGKGGSRYAALTALLNAKTIAVVGLDERRERTAYRIAEYLQRAGYRVIPVWFQQPATEVLGERAYASLQEIPEHVDLVDVFVRSEQT